MTSARTLEYPQQPPRRRSRRRTWIVSTIVIVVTLIIAAIAADRIVDFTAERRIAEALDPYAEATVDVEGFPVLTQMAGGELDTIHITADQARYEDIEFTDVEAKLFDVPVDTSRPVGTVEGTAVLPLSSIESLAAEHASLPEGMTFTSLDGELFLKGTLLGQDLLIGIDLQPDSRRVLIDASQIRLGSASVDVDSLPSFLTSAISDIVIDLDFLPAGLELTDLDATEAGLKFSVHGTGVSLN